jgi:hypothetical protein
MAQSAVVIPEAPPAKEIVKVRDEPEISASVRFDAPKIDQVATRPDGEVRLGEAISLYVEIDGEVAWESNLQIDWFLNGDLLEDEHESSLDTLTLSPGDIVVVKARTNETKRASRAIASAPIRVVRPAPPQISSQPNARIVNGEYRYRLEAESALEGAVLKFGLAKGPEGMSVDGETGLMTWSPGSSQTGRFEIDITVTDQWGSGSAQSFLIDVAAAGDAPPASTR